HSDAIKGELVCIVSHHSFRFYFAAVGPHVATPLRIQRALDHAAVQERTEGPPRSGKRRQGRRPKRRYNLRIMSLASGTKLGPYESQALLGAGGMGEVYRAQDTRLGRVVAVKVLPSALAQNTELRRLYRVLRLLASQGIFAEFSPRTFSNTDVSN